MVRIVRVVIQVHPSSSKVDLDITTFKLELQPSCSGCGRESCRAARLRARLCCEGEPGLGFGSEELPRVRRGDRYTALLHT